MRELLSLFFILTGVFVFANDTSGRAAPAGGIIFEKSEDIEMVQEALYLSAGLIEVNYLFRNTSDKDIANDIYFPLPDMNCQGDADSIEGPANYDFKLWINGKRTDYDTHISIVSGGKDFTEKFKPLFSEYCPEGPDYPYICYPPSTAQLVERIKTFPPEEQKHFFKYEEELMKKYGGVSDCSTGKYEYCYLDCNMKVTFHWMQTFPAGKTIHIKHSYSPEYYSDSMGDSSFKYILTTGKNWKGPIQQFNMLIKRTGNMVCPGNLGQNYNKEYTVADIENFTPEQDLAIRTPCCQDVCDGETDVYASCNYEEGCMFYREKGKRPLCRFLRNEEDSSTIYRRITGTLEGEWFKTGYYGGGYMKIEKGGEKEWKYGMPIEKSLSADTNLPLCSKITGKEDMTPALYRVDGPANIRFMPNGKKTGEFADKSYVWVLSREGNWFNVVQGGLRGWTHKDNLINIWEEYDKAGGAI
jgi:hypothetical protein